MARRGKADVQVSSRGQVDPQIQQYFSEIAALVGEGGSLEDPEERATVCANALEEARGKELHLACNSTCGRVLETLLSSSDISQVALFLQQCTPVFTSMSLDPGGSHVAEAALKSVAAALNGGGGVEGAGWYSTVERAISKICEAVEEGKNAVDLMRSRYGSHVLRQLLALCSGLPLEASPKSGAGVKLKSGLAQRLGNLASKPRGVASARSRGRVFPDQLKSLVGIILESCRGSMVELRAGSAGGPALQTILRAVEGDKSTVTKVIAVMLECGQQAEVKEGVVLEKASVEKTVEMIQDCNGSHLMEVMLQVAPDAIYMEMFQRFFRHHLLQLSLHPSANFVVQALIAAARHAGQVNMMVEELEASFVEVIAERRGGVVAALLAACARFRTRQREVCRVLAHAINPDTPSPNCIVPRMLFLENLSGTGRFPAEWKPPFGSRMSVVGCTMLQTAFGFPQECCQQFCASIAAMEATSVVDTVRDPSGSRVVEAFLLSGAAPLKHKHRLISKLKGHFAELAVHPICSYTVEKCFTTGDLKLKEVIAAELSHAQPELSKTRHGPYLLKRCDIALYAKGPEEWRMRASSKQGTREAFAEIFQAETEALNIKPETATTPATDVLSTGQRKRQIKEANGETPVSTRMSSELLASTSALKLDGAMAELGFSFAKGPELKRKKEASTSSKPDFGVDGNEFGSGEGISPSQVESGKSLKKDEIDALFKRQDKPRKLKKKNRKLGKLKETDNGSASADIHEVDPSLRLVMGAIEGGLKKSKRRKGESQSEKLDGVVASNKRKKGTQHVLM